MVYLFFFSLYWSNWLSMAPQTMQLPTVNPLVKQDVMGDAPLELTLVFAGDIMGHGPQIRAAEVVENLHYDYTECFQHIKHYINSTDIAIANLEVTLPGQPPYSGYPLFKSPDALALALRDAGFDIMLTANNHSNDGGRLGVVETINTLYKFGFYQTGSFQSTMERDAYYPLILYKNGIKIALLNYTYSTNGLVTKPPTIVNVIDETLIKQDMEEAHRLDPDCIIVVMHWGNEYSIRENRGQRELAQKIMSWGADLIVGAHPHVVQPIRLMKGRNGEIVPVAYSLGNLISNQQKKHTDGGILLEVKLRKKNALAKAKVNSIQYIPIWRYRRRDSDGKLSFTVLPVSAVEAGGHSLDLSKDATRKLNSFASFIRNHLSDSDIPEKKFTPQEILAQ